MMEYTVFGESHGPAVGVLIQNIPAGLPVDETLIHADLLRLLRSFRSYLKPSIKNFSSAKLPENPVTAQLFLFGNCPLVSIW